MNSKVEKFLSVAADDIGIKRILIANCWSSLFDQNCHYIDRLRLDDNIQIISLSYGEIFWWNFTSSINNFANFSWSKLLLVNFINSVYPVTYIFLFLLSSKKCRSNI